jgi:hypothetical protein
VADFLSAPANEVNQMRRELNVVNQDNDNTKAVVDCEQRKTGPFIRFAAHGLIFYMRPTQYIKKFVSFCEILIINAVK